MKIFIGAKGRNTINVMDKKDFDTVIDDLVLQFYGQEIFDIYKKFPDVSKKENGLWTKQTKTSVNNLLFITEDKEFTHMQCRYMYEQLKDVKLSTVHNRTHFKVLLFYINYCIEHKTPLRFTLKNE